MNKRDYVKAIEASRELVRSGKYAACPCSNVRCEWHGNCFECVMIHRVKKKHVPECLQPILRDRIRDLAGVAELKAVEARPTKAAVDYLHKVSPPAKKRRRKEKA